MIAFPDAVEARRVKTNSALVVGMDPIAGLMPPEIAPPPEASPACCAERFHCFACAVFEVVSDLAVAVKFQSAYYERLGEPGFGVLRRSLAEAKERGLLTIFDGKRSDIGSTAAAYADAYLGDLPETCGPYVDALTVNPYFGEDGVRPFVEAACRRGKGVFVVVKSSNPSGPQFQDLTLEGAPLFEHVSGLVHEVGSSSVGTCGLSCVGAVVGATYPAVLRRLRGLMPKALFLLPGVGAQGGAVRELRHAFLPGKRGALIAVSRSLLYAYRSAPGTRWRDALRKEAERLVEELRALES